MHERPADVAIIGAGSAGLAAVRHVRRQTKSVLLVDDGPYSTTPPVPG